MIKLAVSGCQGRMGQSIAWLALADNNFKLTTLLEHKDHPKINETMHDLNISTNNADLKECDTLIEFTSPEATIANLQACVQCGVKMVIGTTGLKGEDFQAIRKASEKIPIVLSGNMSLGVNILFKLTQLLAKITPDGYSAKITEAHHIHKKDKPSGTAKMLEEFIDWEDCSEELSYNRKRAETESIREGEIIGDHAVVFESNEDTITVSHHAKNRDIFAKGALVAAKFLVDKDKGLFTMQDVLGLN